MSRVKNLAGRVFGRLTVTGTYEARGSRAYWLCSCVCGKQKSVRSDILLSGRTRSCGCISDERRTYGQRKPDSYLNMLIRVTKESARKRGLSFSLTKDEFYRLVTSDCVYCGDSPKTREAYHKNPDSVFPSVGIDRVNNSKGYEIENCVSCCTPCNMMKKNLSQAEFITHIAKIYENN